MSEQHTSSLCLVNIAPELAAALVEAQGRVAWVGKDGTNKFHHYDYATAEAIIDESRRALVASGLFLAHEWHAERFSSAPVDGGKDAPKLAIGRAVVDYLVLHKSGAGLRFTTSTPIVPEKGRPEDKAEQAALTSNLAYSLRGLLLIPRGEAPGEDIDGRDDGDEPREEQRRPPPRRESAPVVDDVPFQVGDNDAAAVERSPAPARVEHPDVEIVRAAIADIGALVSVGEIRKALASTEILPISPLGRATLERSAALRMISVAATLKELAEVSEMLRAMHKAGNGDADWHDGAAKAYKARRAELTESGQGKA